MPDSISFARSYLNETSRLCQQIDGHQIDRLAMQLSALGGRLFILGIGGSAANASHAVNDFRKLCGLEAYAPTDNVAELTAIANDACWGAIFVDWLCESRWTPQDALLILSVGGGTDYLSRPLVEAMKFAKGGHIWAIVGRSDGYAAHHANPCIILPETNALTPHAEEFQSIILHLLVSHPLLKQVTPIWESLTASPST